MREEILGWRDERISEQHKTYGHDCPMIDIDFVVAEFDSCEPKALVEYKHRNVSGLRELTDRPGSRVLASLANAAGLPAWIAIYCPTTWTYRVIVLNDRAREFFKNWHLYSEREYVERLYAVRGRSAPPDLLARLHDAPPEE